MDEVKRRQTAVLFRSWRRVFGNRWITAREAMAAADDALLPRDAPIACLNDFHAALLAFARTSATGCDLGRRLASVKGHVVEGRQLQQATQKGYQRRWRVVEVGDVDSPLPPSSPEERIAEALERIAEAIEGVGRIIMVSGAAGR
jgi:hypothetical protein